MNIINVDCAWPVATRLGRLFAGSLLRRCCALENSCYYFDVSIALAGQFGCKGRFGRLIFCERIVDDLIVLVLNIRYCWADKAAFSKFLLLQLQFFHF